MYIFILMHPWCQELGRLYVGGAGKSTNLKLVVVLVLLAFIDMVITRVKNGSPNMIVTTFDGKFDEKKDEIPPGICRPHMHQNLQY